MVGKKDIGTWIELIKMRENILISQLASIYGENEELINERLNVL